MQRFIFWLAYPLLWLISVLPFKLFYILSDSIFWIVYFVIRYRRKTVSFNLRLVFPEKSEKEIASIRKKFYRHMVDMFLEMIKSISISDAALKERFVFTNLEEIRRIRSMNKSVILACGHYASYEWMNSLQLYDIDYRAFGIYKKIKNRHFDKLVKDIRGRYDASLIRTTEATATITQNEEDGILGAYAMIADQSPRLTRARTWINFMGIQVPVFTGTEKLSRALDMAVVYLHVEKIRRGYYSATFKTLSSTPATEPKNEITRRYIKELEKQIVQAPEYYLWTHKRWKHRNAAKPDEAIIID